MSDFSKNIEQFVKNLYKIKGIKFGEFLLKSGITSPIYFDLRVIVSHPKIMTQLSGLLIELMKNSNIAPELICGVPYTALPIATLVSSATNIPMVIRRKEQKNYGTARLIEGEFTDKQSCGIIEDVISTGSSIIETARDLEKVGLVVKDAVVVLDREHGALANLAAAGIKTHVLFTLSELLTILSSSGLISKQVEEDVHKFVSGLQGNEQKNGKLKERCEVPFGQRATIAVHPLAKKLFEIMEEKQSLLCLAADVTSSEELLKVAEETGPYVVVLKTHVDALEDFSEKVAIRLSELATRFNFLILEDRKFADIGNTVRLQFSSIQKWASLVTAHSIAGPEILNGLQKGCGEASRGVFLVAELSCKGALTNSDYAKETIAMAEKGQDMVVGVVCQSKSLLTNPGLIQLTPGVRLNEGQDQLGQQYVDPRSAVIEKGADLIVVGRGILQASDRAKEAKKYKTVSYEAYCDRIAVSSV